MPRSNHLLGAALLVAMFASPAVRHTRLSRYGSVFRPISPALTLRSATK
jgi:hypothetical protein